MEDLELLVLTLRSLDYSRFAFVWPVFFIGVWIVGSVIPADSRQRMLGQTTWFDFIFWFVVDAVFRLAMLGLFIALIYEFCGEFLRPYRLTSAQDWPVGIQVLVALLSADFLRWLLHYVKHKIPVLWEFHKVHHSQTELNLFTDYRAHFFEKVFSEPLKILPMYLLNMPAPSAFLLVLALNAYPRITHCNLKTNLGPLKYIFVTPQSHRVHHSILPEHRDRNFGTIFSIWDFLFGTQWMKFDEYPACGITDPDFPNEQDSDPRSFLSIYLRQLVYPFVAVARMLPLSR